MLRSLLILYVFFTLIGCGTKAGSGDNVIDAYITFIGGSEHWHKVNTIVMNGEYDYGGIKFPFTSYAKSPDRYKFVVPFNGKYYAQGFDGTRGWKIDAFKNETSPTILSGEAALAMANESDIYLLNEFLRYEKGHNTMSAGADTTIDQRSCTRIINDSATTWFFDKQSGALVAKKSVAKNPELQGAELITRYSDYREEGGIKIPFRITHETGGQMVLIITVEKVLINQEIKDLVFQPS